MGVSRQRWYLVRVDRLKERRQALGLSQQDLADRTYTSLRMIQRYEMADANPSADILARIAKELGVSADWILGLVDAPNSHNSMMELSPVELRLLAAYDRDDLEGMIEAVMQAHKENKTKLHESERIARGRKRDKRVKVGGSSQDK